MFVKLFIIAIGLFAPAIAGRNSRLLSLIQVYRHGERTPVSFYPTDPYQDFSYWNLTTGQLTNTGKLQHYRLGQYTRQRYGSFIPKYYFRDDFVVRSTNMDRTFMSATSNVAGLYSPKDFQIWKEGLDWQPVPVFPAEQAIISPFDNCQAFSAAATEVLNTEEYFTSINQESQTLLEYISEHTGSNVTSVAGLLLIWDSLLIETLQGFELPEWTKQVYPEPLTSLSPLYYYACGYTEQLKILTTGPFYNNLIEHFEAILTNSSSTQKYLQFSGHDINLALLLNTLGAFNPPSYQVPGFASTIYYELREAKGRNFINIYYIRVSGAKPEPITLAGCGFNCEFSQFKNILSNRTITVDDWYELCNA